MDGSIKTRQTAPSHSEIVLYQTPDGRTAIDVKLENETVWLTQAQMAELFEKDKRTISEHIANIFKEGELLRNSVVRNFRITASDGKSYQTMLYNLDVVISVGYRVKSQRGTQFRIWANSVLKEYLINGYAIRNDLVRERYESLKSLIEVMGRTMRYLNSPSENQIKPIFDVIRDYTYALDTLDNYDYQRLHICSTSTEYMPGKAGNSVFVLGPKWRIHEYLHLNSVETSKFRFVKPGEKIGTQGKSGNAVSTPAHVHYGIVTPVPYVWRLFADEGTCNPPKRFNWRLMFWLDPADHLPER